MASVHVADRIAARVVAAWRRARATPRSADRTDAVVTFAVGVLCVAIGAVDVLQGTGAPTLLGPWDHVLTLAVGCLLMLAKRRAPALALPAGVALFAVDARLGGSLGLVLVLFDLVFSAALHGSARLLRVLQVAAAVAVAGTAVAVGLASGEVALRRVPGRGRGLRVARGRRVAGRGGRGLGRRSGRRGRRNGVGHGGGGVGRRSGRRGRAPGERARRDRGRGAAKWSREFLGVDLRQASTRRRSAAAEAIGPHTPAVDGSRASHG